MSSPLSLSFFDAIENQFGQREEVSCFLWWIWANQISSNGCTLIGGLGSWDYERDSEMCFLLLVLWSVRSQFCLSIDKSCEERARSSNKNCAQHTLRSCHMFIIFQVFSKSLVEFKQNILRPFLSYPSLGWVHFLQAATSGEVRKKNVSIQKQSWNWTSRCQWPGVGDEVGISHKNTGDFDKFWHAFRLFFSTNLLENCEMFHDFMANLGVRNFRFPMSLKLVAQDPGVWSTQPRHFQDQRTPGKDRLPPGGQICWRYECPSCFFWFL